jgi:hypothetical protein
MQFQNFKEHEKNFGDHISVYYSSTVQCTSEQKQFLLRANGTSVLRDASFT